MNGKFLVCFVLAAVIVYVDAHGKLIEPPSRAAAWRFDDRFPFHRNDGEWCRLARERNRRETLDVSRNRNVTCGVCGPIYDGDATVRKILKKNGKDDLLLQSSERTSQLYTGIIVREYIKGEIIDAVVEIDVKHGGGPVEFSICKNEDPNVDVGQSCLDRNTLEFENGETQIDLFDGRRATYRMTPIQMHPSKPTKFDALTYRYRVKLPEDLTCERCLFQWRWIAHDTTQVYHGCADVSIKAK